MFGFFSDAEHGMIHAVDGICNINEEDLLSAFSPGKGLKAFYSDSKTREKTRWHDK